MLLLFFKLLWMSPSVKTLNINVSLIHWTEIVICGEKKEQRRESTEEEEPHLMNLLKQTGQVFTNAWLQMAELCCPISHIEHDLAATIIPPTCLFHPHLSLTDCLFPPLVCPTLAIWLLTMWHYKGWGQGPQQQRSAHCLWIKKLEEWSITGRRGIVSIYRLSVLML